MSYRLFMAIIPTLALAPLLFNQLFVEAGVMKLLVCLPVIDCAGKRCGHMHFLYLQV